MFVSLLLMPPLLMYILSTVKNNVCGLSADKVKELSIPRCRLTQANPCLHILPHCKANKANKIKSLNIDRT